jgi:hypothetical protein
MRYLVPEVILLKKTEGGEKTRMVRTGYLRFALGIE